MDSQHTGQKDVGLKDLGAETLSCPRMRRFKWIEWNLQKIAAHHLSTEEVGAAFERVYQLDERDDGSFQMFAELLSGRRIWVIWGTIVKTTRSQIFSARSRTPPSS